MTDAAPAAEGHIITFYSYKGGTGRSMALANVAWILASGGKRVLVIDWDLEAPGIHRYFHPFLKDKSLSSSEGLMEFLLEYVSHALTPRDGQPVDDHWFSSLADIVEYAQSLRWAQFPKPGTIDFIPAGRQSDSYATTVNLFNWNQFYDKLGGERFFEEAKKHMQADYDYILIDSRTGVSDTSGICTIQMPDTVVLCFTLNTQSIEGAAAVAETIQREQNKRGREIRIFPVPTRVDRSEKERLELARVEAWRKFDRFLSHMTPQERTEYWAAAEVPYEPWYGFEEVLAIFGDRTRVQTSILTSMETLTSHISAGAITTLNSVTEAERTRVLAQYLRGRAEESETERADVATRGDSALARLSAPLQARALATILRLAHIGADGSATPRRANRRDLGNVPDRVMQALRYADLIIETKQPDGSESVELSGANILSDWTRLQRAIEEDKPFLLWRQVLSAQAAEWERSRSSRALLRGEGLTAARRYLRRRADDFNPAERALIGASKRRRGTVLAIAASLLIAMIAAGIVWTAWKSSDAYQLQRVYNDAPLSMVDDSAEAEEAVGRWIRALVSVGRVSEAQGVASSARTLARKGVRYAILATALNDMNELTEATKAAEGATTAVAGIAPPSEQARAQVDVAGVLSSKYPETATGLLYYAKKLAAYHDEEKESARPEGVSDTDPQLVLWKDLIVSLQRLGNASQAAEAAADADAVLQDVAPQSRAFWLLDLAVALERSGGRNLATAKRQEAFRALELNWNETIRSRLLPDIVKELTRNGDRENCALVLESLRRARFLGGDGIVALEITLRALARWPAVGPEDLLWRDAERLVRSLPAEQRDEMSAALAAALAACGNIDRAKTIISDVGKRAATGGAAVMAALSEAQYRVGDRDNERALRDQAWQQALLESNEELQSGALLKVALAAARCRDVPSAARIAEKAPRNDVRRRQLPDLIAAIADAARASSDAAALASARSIVVLAAQSDRADPALFNAVRSLAAAAKGSAALEVAKAIGNDEAQYEALQEIDSTLGENMNAEALRAHLHEFAKSIDDPYYAALAFTTLAVRQPRTAAVQALREAEDRVDRIEQDRQSEVLGRIADGYAREGDLRAARRAAMECTDPIDRLSAFAAIVDPSAAPRL